MAETDHIGMISSPVLRLIIRGWSHTLECPRWRLSVILLRWHRHPGCCCVRSLARADRESVRDSLCALYFNEYKPSILGKKEIFKKKWRILVLFRTECLLRSNSRFDHFVLFLENFSCVLVSCKDCSVPFIVVDIYMCRRAGTYSDCLFDCSAVLRSMEIEHLSRDDAALRLSSSLVSALLVTRVSSKRPHSDRYGAMVISDDAIVMM